MQMHLSVLPLLILTVASPALAKRRKTSTQAAIVDDRETGREVSPPERREERQSQPDQAHAPGVSLTEAAVVTSLSGPRTSLESRRSGFFYSAIVVCVALWFFLFRAPALLSAALTGADTVNHEEGGGEKKPIGMGMAKGAMSSANYSTCMRSADSSVDQQQRGSAASRRSSKARVSTDTYYCRMHSEAIRSMPRHMLPSDAEELYIGDNGSSCRGSDIMQSMGSRASSVVSSHQNLEEAAKFEHLPPWKCTEGDREPGLLRRCEEPEVQGSTGWADVPEIERFQLRGKDYMKDGRKVPASSCAFAVHQVHILRTSTMLRNAAGRLPSLKAFLEAHPQHFFFIFNRMLPDRNRNDGTVINVIVLLARQLPKGVDPTFDQQLDQFLTGTDEYRNARLKYLPAAREAPRVVKNAIWVVGGEKPVILGKGYLMLHYESGTNYIEVDIDASPSTTACMATSLTMKHGSSMVLEEMLVLEGQADEELPERPLGTWRWMRFEVSSAITDVDTSTLCCMDEGGTP